MKTTWRFFTRNKLSGIINIIGLSTGIACSIIIYLYINHELSFDRYHSQKDRIYRIALIEEGSEGTDYNSETPYPLAQALRAQFSEDILITRMQLSDRASVRVGEKLFNENYLLFAEPEIFNVFDFDWISGNQESAIKELNTVVLTQSCAEKYFPGLNPTGKTISITNIGNLIVTGVVADPPDNTHLPYSMLINLESLTDDFIGMNYDRWNVILGGFFTYTLLPDNLGPDDFENQLNEFARNFMEEQGETEMTSRLVLTSLKDIHHDKNYSTINYTTSKTTILIISLIGLFILIMACINYVNLAIAQAIRRSREIGIKKVLGVGRQGLIRQYVTDALLFTLIALVFALILVEIFTPSVNTFLGNNINLGIYHTPSAFIYIIILVLVISVISGFYPAIVISGYSPVAAIKNKINSHNRTTRVLKNGLVVFQFTISQILIISTLIINSQLEFMTNRDLGFESESIIATPVPDIKKADLFRHEIAENPDVLNMTFAISAPQTIVDQRFETVIYSREIDNAERIDADVKAADNKYLNVFGLKIQAGEFYEEARGKDSLFNIVINETLCKRLGYKTADSVLGARINMGRIIGVVKDFHIESLHNNIIPMVMIHYTPFFGQAFIKVASGEIGASINHIQRVWEGFFPDETFEYSVYETFLDQMYSHDTRILRTISVFSLIAIIIACLGLFGLVSYMITQKTKEVSIRKVFGASVNSIIFHITKSYFVLILVSNIIAFPLAWYFMKNWLANFAYQINISRWVFVLTLIFSLLLTLGTIIIHIVRIARTNPVDALKYE